MAGHMGAVQAVAAEALATLPCITDSFADELLVRKDPAQRAAAFDPRQTLILDATIGGIPHHKENIRLLRACCDNTLTDYLDALDNTELLEPFEQMCCMSEMVRGVVMQHYSARAYGALCAREDAGERMHTVEDMRRWMRNLVSCTIVEPTRGRICDALRMRERAFEKYQHLLDEAKVKVLEHLEKRQGGPSLADALPEDVLLKVMARMPAKTAASLHRCCNWRTRSVVLERQLRGAMPQLCVFESTDQFPHGWGGDDVPYVVAGARGGQGVIVGLFIGLARPATEAEAARLHCHSEDSEDSDDSDDSDAFDGSDAFERTGGWQKRDGMQRSVDAYCIARHVARRESGNVSTHLPSRLSTWLDEETERKWTLQSASDYDLSPTPVVTAVELVEDCGQYAAMTAPALADGITPERRLKQASGGHGRVVEYPIQEPPDARAAWRRSRWVMRDGGVQPVYAEYVVSAEYLSGKRGKLYRLRVRTNHPGISHITRAFRILSKHPQRCSAR